MAVWVVLEDSRWWIAFTVPLAWVPALVAACGGNPPSNEALLVASDFYRRGLAADVTDRLIEADRVRLGRRPPDERTGTVAEGSRQAGTAPPARPAPDGQLHISLPKHAIAAQGRATELVHQRGELEIAEGDRGTGKYVTYQLPGEWNIRSAREAPW